MILKENEEDRSQLGRGWDRGDLFRPARLLDIRYGHGLTKSESAKWPSFIAVANRTAWSNVQKYLAKEPEAVGIVRQLDWNHLEEVSQGLPSGAELVVGIGGGTALDASKYVALRHGLPLRLVPSAVSTGAIVHGVFAKWEGRSTVGGGSEWPYCDFEHVLVDYDLVLETPQRLNTAGIGDVLCSYSGIAEWEYGAARGTAPPVDEGLTGPAIDYFESIARGFPETLDADGALTADSIRFIMTSIQERDDRQFSTPYAPGSGHSMTLAIEQATQMGLVHGEMAALGAVIVCWATVGAERLSHWLDVCNVRYRPGDIGLSRNDLKRSLEFASEYFRDREPRSILVHEPVVGERFDRIWQYLEDA